MIGISKQVCIFLVAKEVKPLFKHLLSPCQFISSSVDWVNCFVFYFWNLKNIDCGYYYPVRCSFQRLLPLCRPSFDFAVIGGVELVRPIQSPLSILEIIFCSADVLLKYFLKLKYNNSIYPFLILPSNPSHVYPISNLWLLASFSLNVYIYKWYLIYRYTHTIHLYVYVTHTQFLSLYS